MNFKCRSVVFPLVVLIIGIKAQGGCSAGQSARLAQLWECEASNPNQQWSLDASSKKLSLVGVPSMIIRNYSASELPRWPRAEWGIPDTSPTAVLDDLPTDPEAAISFMWSIVPDSDGKSVNIKSIDKDGADTGYCLGAASESQELNFVIESLNLRGYPGTEATVVPCDGLGQANQIKWQKIESPNEDGSFQLKHVDSQGNCLDVGSSASCHDAHLKDLPFCDRTLSPKDRAKDLVSRLDNTEKMMQMRGGYILSSPGVPRLGVRGIQIVEDQSGVGTFCGTPTSEDSTGCPTVFPAGPSLGATMNRTLWEEVARTSAIEARGLSSETTACPYFSNCFRPGPVSGYMTFAPNQNLARDPRWGRTGEVVSEDVVLTSEWAKVMVRGLQTERDGVLAAGSTIKHFAFYDFENSTAEGLIRFTFNANISRKDAAQFYLPSFKVSQAEDPLSLMCAYEAFHWSDDPDPPKNGVPLCAAKNLTEGLLRGRWGWDGYIASDDVAIDIMWALHGYVPDRDSAISAAFEAGVDMDTGVSFDSNLIYMIDIGKVSQETLDRAATRVLTAGASLGQFDPAGSGPWDNVTMDDVDTPAHRQLALEAGEQGIALLKNKNGALPFAPGEQLAIVGAAANFSVEMSGVDNYNGTSLHLYENTPLLALLRRNESSVYSYGAERTGNDTQGILAAQQACADVGRCVLLVASHPAGEQCDNVHVTPSPGQIALARAVLQATAQAGGTVTIVTMGVTPVTLPPDVVAAADAVVSAPLPGELGGEAIARILYGETCPSGRLTVSHYPSQFERRKPTDMRLSGGGGSTYAWYDASFFGADMPFKFGEGLSYEQIDTKSLSIHVAARDPCNHAVRGSRTGARDCSSKPDAARPADRELAATQSQEDQGKAPLLTLNTSELCKGAASVTVNVTVGRQASFEGPVATSMLAIVQFPAELVNQGAAPPNGQLLGFEKVLLPSANDQSVVAIELDVRHLARPIGPLDVAGVLPGGVVSPGVYPVRVGAPGMWQDGTIELVGSACGATQAAMPW